MAAGDLDALTELHRRLGNTVYAVAYRILTEPDEAGRVVSETFADVWREAGGFDAKESRVDRWLVQTARTKAQARVLILDRI